MEFANLTPEERRVAVAQTVIAHLAQRSVIKERGFQVFALRAPDEEAAYRAALHTVATFLGEPPGVPLSEMRLSVRALNIAEARGVYTVTDFMALSPSAFCDLCEAPMTSDGVRREYRDLRNFMLRPLGVQNLAETAARLSAELEQAENTQALAKV
jgi:hypothetical protein